MDIPVTLPLDSDGFLWRECPTCVQQFKWHYGPANEEAETQPNPVTYYCPLCSEPGAPDTWMTQQQIDYIQGFAAPQILRSVQDELAAAFGTSGSNSFKFEVTSSGDMPDVPMSLTEPDDMVMVASPCHGYEPVKVPDGLAGPFHCLVCGQVFAV